MSALLMRTLLAIAIGVLTAFCPQVRADIVLTKDTPDLALTEGLRVSDISQWGRRAINVDGVVQMMVDGTLGEPKAGDVVKRPEAMGGGERKWEEVKANEKGEFGGDGWMRGGAGSYVLCIVEAEEPRVMVLSGVGHSMVYVNGEPRVGDPYMHGYVRIPVALKKGRNQLLFAHAGRGMFKARLEVPKGSGGVEINSGDLTLPDVLGPNGDVYALGVPLVNCSDLPRRLVVFTDGPGELDPAQGVTAMIVPLGIYKAPVKVSIRPPKGAREVSVRLRVFDGEQASELDRAPGPDVRPLAEETITLRVRESHEIHKRTFVSAIDGSVQYVAIVPPRIEVGGGKSEVGSEEPKGDASGSESRPTQDKPSSNPQSEIRNPKSPRPGLVLSLHGASVEAIRQAESYAPKNDLVIVCPTNRRPFGFDWEDWGRVDAIEAMDHAKKWYDTDPSRQYLTGHSMGGHGTWQLGVLYPDRFAAIAPSAGWLSFESYAAARGDADKKPEHPAAEFFSRASASSDTVALMENLRGKGIYILHGDADDNVPVSEARTARAELDKLGIAYEFHEQPGAGHWWGGKSDPGAGAACVDWKPIFEMFRVHSLAKPSQQTDRELTLCSFQSSLMLPFGNGLAIVRQHRSGEFSKVKVRVETQSRLVTVNATNVDWLSIGRDVLPEGSSVQLIINDQRRGMVGKAERGSMVEYVGGPVADADLPNILDTFSSKYGRFNGPFKNAFLYQFTLVYGTGGSHEETRWALAKARFDADQWWYRGNGTARIIADRSVTLSLDVLDNHIYYGRFAGSAAAVLDLMASPIPGAIRDRFDPPEFGGKLLAADAAVLATCKAPHFMRQVAYIGGTSLRGMRATDRLPYFLSGVGFPDVTVFDADIWSRGMAGVAGVGFFGYDWSVDKGEFWWRDLPAK